MVSLSIHNCKYCMTLPSLGQLPSLKELSISNLYLLETTGPEFYFAQEGERSTSTFLPFSSLEHMKFENMRSWKNWLPFVGINFAFPRLRTMELHNCPELRGDLPYHLSCMEEIEIQGCYKLFETLHTLHWLSAVNKIKIENDLNHEVYAESTPWLMLENDSPLQHAGAESYPMFISKMITSSICLTHLTLWNIQSLTAFPTNGLPTSLQSLRIIKCSKLSFMPLETFQNYTSLVSLCLLASCDELTSFPLNGFPALQTLSIAWCKSLDSIFISESPSLLESSLQSLEIMCSNSIDLFKVNLQMDTLTELEHLNMMIPCGELSFCEGVCLPPKLQFVVIYSSRTTPHVKEWGLQDLTALSSLTIGVSDEMDNALTMDSFLPMSLLSLTVGDNISFKENGVRYHCYNENCHSQ